ncbi:MAG: CoA transferase [Deltaproteobacteria bacterium]|nr:CoA transferase [Deltaproteobacteria bacterium]
MSGALDGTVAIDASGHVAGPYAGSLLGDLGCEVIKVELPGGGDPARGRESYGPVFRVLNRNKKSVTLNLREAEARDILCRMLERADILIESFRPGTRKALGLDYEDLRRRNPALIHCSVTAFGQSGPYEDRPGFESIGQAVSGMLSLLTDPHDPRMGGLSITAHVTGVFAAYGILAALAARGRTGTGQFVDVSLLQASMGFIESHFAEFLNGGAAVTPENFQRGRLFCLPAGDGRPLLVHLATHQRSWEALVRVIERPDLLDDPRFAAYEDRVAHHDDLMGILREVFGGAPRAAWLERLGKEDLSHAPIYAAEEVFEDPQVRHLGLPREIHHPERGTTRLIGSSVNLSGTPPRLARPAPLVGENTEEVLQALGYGEEAVRSLRERGVV